MKRPELVISGPAAVRARFQRDPDSILRLFFDYPTSRRIGVMCKALAQRRKVYRCVEPSELEAIAGTVHHGGLVAVVTAPEWRAPTDADVARWAKARTPLLLLDRIGNPHNLGAIARSAAFFGLEHLFLPAVPEAALPGEAAHRVAEGGLECMTVWRMGAWLEFIRALGVAGYDVVGASAHGGHPVRGGRIAADGRPERPVALVLGNEEHGLSPEVASACGRLVTLPGRGEVESLNVSAAAAVLLWELVGRPVGGA